MAIGAHVIGGLGLIGANKKRLGAQEGVAGMTVLKTGFTLAALGVTGYARLVGKRMEEISPAPAEGVTEPGNSTPSALAEAQKQQRLLQWAIPALTGTVVVLNAYMGEQQRTSSVVSGVADRVRDRLN